METENRKCEKMYVARVTRKGQVTIPKEIREKLGIKEGDYVAFIIEDNKVILKKAQITVIS